MCGIAGIVGGAGRLSDRLEDAALRMAGAIRHRGPDDAGLWRDPTHPVCLVHRRLSIVDLSPAGHQPMASEGGRFVLTFNGEMYNHAQLRAELEAAGAAPAWRGHSDTETLLAAFMHWGVEAALARAVGMFAIALWDRRDKTLHLARDRFGEKPLYYGWVAGDFVFGSELKALRALPGFANPVSRGALTQYFRFMYVPAPRSIFEGIYKLEPGCVLSVSGAAPARPPADPLRAPGSYETLTMRRWWSLAEAVEAGARNLITDEQEAVEALAARMQEAVRLQSLADVPLGAFLSGGVDSSTVVALMQQQAWRPVKTFTIGFEEAGFDESPHALAVARHLGTDHSALMVTAQETRAVIPLLPSMYDEPFADSSQVPTHLVCRAARQQVTVALSGDGGDELFGGYNRYFWGPRVWDRLSWLPYPMRRGLGAFIRGVPTGGWNAVGTVINQLQPRNQRLARVGDKAHKLAARLHGVRTMQDLYVSLVSEWQSPATVVAGAPPEPPSALADPLPLAGMGDDRLRMMYWDGVSYLPDDILCKVDRAAMAVSLETRVPLLDHRVAEVAWRLPLDMKIRGQLGKWALRQVLYRHVPRELIERPKAGFAIPVGQWMSGPLRGWAEDLIDPARLEREGYLDPGAVRQVWRQHLAGSHEWTARLWSVLMFQSWLEANA